MASDTEQSGLACQLMGFVQQAHSTSKKRKTRIMLRSAGFLQRGHLGQCPASTQPVSRL